MHVTPSQSLIRSLLLIVHTSSHKLFAPLTEIKWSSELHWISRSLILSRILHEAQRQPKINCSFIYHSCITPPYSPATQHESAQPVLYSNRVEVNRQWNGDTIRKYKTYFTTALNALLPCDKNQQKDVLPTHSKQHESSVIVMPCLTHSSPRCDYPEWRSSDHWQAKSEML